MAAVPRVGIAIFVIRPNGTFIIGQRADPNSLGYKTYAVPGGHLEMHESFAECAARELHEETGIVVSELDSIKFLTVVSTSFPKEGKHYVTVFMGVRVPEVEAELLEPDKCFGWSWIEWRQLVEQDREYFEPLLVLVRSQDQRREADWLEKEMLAP